jgi:hypothetical protein
VKRLRYEIKDRDKPNVLKDQRLTSLKGSSGVDGGTLAHSELKDMPSATNDDHTLYSRIDGSRAFTGTVGGVDPVASSDLATKEYVDQAIDFIQTYYLNDTASDIGGIYYKMLESPTGEAESSFPTAGLGTGDDQALTNWATDPAIPGVNTLLAGVYSAHIHAAKTAGTKPAQIYFAVYTRTSGGSETLRATSEVSGLVGAAKDDYDLHATISADVDINTTDRIVIKWFANVGTTGSNVTITLYAEGDDASRFEIPTTTEVLSSIFVRQDGTKPFELGSDADGDIWYRASSAVARLAKGTAGQHLTMNSGATAPEWTTPPPLHEQHWMLTQFSGLNGASGIETDMNCISAASDTYGITDGTSITAPSGTGYDWTNHKVTSDYTALAINNKAAVTEEVAWEKSGQIAFYVPFRKEGTSVVVTARIKRSGTAATSDGITTLWVGVSDQDGGNVSSVSKLVSAVGTSWEDLTTTAVDVTSYDTELELFLEMSTSAEPAITLDETSTIHVHEIIVQQY